MISVSCIIPVYNLENKINICIESLLNQTLKDIEIILVNDCSTDNTISIINNYKKQYNNIKVINLKKNQRQGGARNRGLENAIGDYVYFIDGDDWTESEMLSEMLKYAMDNNLDIVDSDYFQDDVDGKTEYRTGIPNEYFPVKDYSIVMLNGGRLWTKLIRRKFLVENNIKFIEGKKFEDNPYLPILYSYKPKIGKVNKAYYHYLYNSDSTSRKKNDYTIFDRLDTAIYMLEETKRIGVYNKFKEEINYLFIQFYYANTIVACITRFDKLQIDYIKKVYKDVNKILPNYRNNVYLKSAPYYIKVFTSVEQSKLIFLCKLIFFVYNLGFSKFIIKKAKE